MDLGTFLRDYGLIITIALILVVAAPRILRSAQVAMKGAPAQATVLQLSERVLPSSDDEEDDPSSPATEYTYQLDVHPVQGAAFKATWKTEGFMAPYSRGDTLNIKFLPDDHSRVVVMGKAK